MNHKQRPKRFTLRKEYFGGLVYDAKLANTTLLDVDEYAFLISISNNNKQAGSLSEKLKKRIKKFASIGFISIPSSHNIKLLHTRVIPPIKQYKKGVLSAPIRVFDSYTRRCNFNCDQCYFSSSAFVEEDRRTIQETKDIIRKFYEAGTMEWRFTGGEALICNDIFEAIQTAKDYGMNVGLYSNGWWVDSIASKVFASRLDEITISLEGDEPVNDARRRKGGYKKVVETFERIAQHNKKNRSKNIHVTIATAVGIDNVECVPFLARLAASYKFNINFMPLKPSGRARYTLEDEMLDTKQYLEFARAVEDVRKDRGVKKSGIKIILKYKDLFNPKMEDRSSRPFPFNYAECGALTTAVSMMPDGTLFSCPFVLDVDIKARFTGPNIRDMAVHEAWFHPKFENYRNAVKTECLDCKYYMKQCRGKCRATVLGFGGDIANGELIGNDPQCFAHLID